MTATASAVHLDSKPSSPSSPTASFQPQQSSAAQRSFINLNPSIRGQSSPFPATPAAATPFNSFLEPPQGVSYLGFIRTWSDSHVARWLADIKCAHHGDTFKNNDIRGDILLELDIPTLKEMGVSSIGDRLRIANAVKILRQKASSKPLASPPSVESNRPSRLNVNVDIPETRPSAADSSLLQALTPDTADPSPTSRLASRSGRPAPLQLHTSSSRNDLPRIIRDQQPPDSAKSSYSSRPMINTSSSTPSLSAATPVTTQSSARSAHPHLPPIPRSHPPPPPPNRTPVRNLINGGSQTNGRRTPTQADAPAYTNQPLPPAPSSSTPSSLQTPSSGWSNTYPHLPADPRPGNTGGKPTSARSTSPYLPPRTTSRTNAHGRSGSSSLSSPSTSTSNKIATRPLPGAGGNHPYAAAQPSLQPPTHTGPNLSPIAESFHQLSSSSTPSPPTNAYSVGRGPFQPPGTSLNPSLDDLRKYIVKFTLPAEGQTCKVNIGDCPGGIEILEKVLKKMNMNKDGSRTINFERATLEGGGLSLDGWSVYMEFESGEPLSESELMSICHAPNHPTRENGLIIKRSSKKRTDDYDLQIPSSSRSTKRASSISILSGLGVPNPEKALDPPSPTQSLSLNPSYAGKKPSKLRNFFGQRPPSELITTHLTEYFPFTEKRVLERTARNSMMHRRDSLVPYNQQQLPSRFSSSTQGSIGRGSSSPSRNSISSFAPPLPDKTYAAEDIPRVSLSTDDGRSVDLQSEDEPRTSYLPQLLPPIPFPTESLSQSLEDITGGSSSRSNKPSNASSRTSFMKELRSKRDWSDTASLMTVDQITANVESRRESLAIDRMAIDSNVNSEIDEWTKESDVETNGTTLVEEEVEVEVTVGGDDDNVDIIESPSGEGPDGDEDEDDEMGKAMMSEGNKWIKGALIGSGSFGKVYLGMDASSGLLMAVKQVELPSGSAPNEERKKSMLSALEREIELLKDLRHDNIVQYLYSSADDEYLNIFLEYVPGGSVAALLRNYGAFEETLVKNFVRQILQGLHYLHERNIIHRDIKGGNILVDNKGGIKISDFGISKKADSLMSGNRAHRPSLQGSVFWMAPEVVKQSGHTNKADIWSVGCLVVEMLTGEHPWAQLTQMQAIFKIGSSAKPTIPSDISAEAQDFLRSTFELNLDDRPSAGDLLLHAWVVVKKTSAKGNVMKAAPAALSQLEVSA